MAGPVAGFGQQPNLNQNTQQAVNLGVQQRPTESREKVIQPQGTRIAGAEEGNQGRQESLSDPQVAAEQILASQKDIQRGAVINLLI